MGSGLGGGGTLYNVQCSKFRVGGLGHNRKLHLVPSLFSCHTKWWSRGFFGEFEGGDKGTYFLLQNVLSLFLSHWKHAHPRFDQKWYLDLKRDFFGKRVPLLKGLNLCSRHHPSQNNCQVIESLSLPPPPPALFLNYKEQRPPPPSWNLGSNWFVDLSGKYNFRFVGEIQYPRAVSVPPTVGQLAPILTQLSLCGEECRSSFTRPHLHSTNQNAPLLHVIISTNQSGAPAGSW